MVLNLALSLGASLLAACGSGTASESPSGSGSPGADLNAGLLGGGGSSSGGNSLASITICGTTVANSSTNCPATAPCTDTDSSGFWNPVDIFYTSAANRAVIFLHGGGGTNYGMAYDLGLNDADTKPLAIDVDFSWLSANKIIAVFPQGQGLRVGGTWNNWVMDSGQDDETMLQALAAYIQKTYGVSSIYLVGHSNGGMMVNRMWCESPATFDGYVALAGPASQHYLTPGNACAPLQSELRPYFGLLGAQDTVLCDNGASTVAGPDDPVDGCSSSANWSSSTWTVSSAYVQGNSASNWVNPVLINESQQQLLRAGLLCGETALTPDLADSNSLSTIWTNCGGSLRLQEVLGANHPLSYSHELCPLLDRDQCSLEVASGSGSAGSTGLLGVIVAFLNSVGQ